MKQGLVRKVSKLTAKSLTNKAKELTLKKIINAL
jgi:hypothetical protein